MKIGTKEFDTTSRVYIMGILNVTPDSFSDGGSWNQIDKALYHVAEMIEEGADIIDIGGESTRPGYTLISAAAEIERTAPVIEAIRKRFDIPLSIDTYKSAVAREALLAGADLVNDIWGLLYDEEMGKVIAQSGKACCLMHNRSEPVYQDYLKDVVVDLQRCLAAADRAGIAKEKIILDPGIGFGKTFVQNKQLMNHLEIVTRLGFPVLLGISRKSVIGNALDLPVTERLEGTLALTAIGVMKGCSIMRVHDVKANRRAADMALAIRESC